MIIELSLFLYIYLALLFVYLLFSGFNLYHMYKFGLNRYIAFMGTFIYIGGIVFILLVSGYFMFGIEWSTEISLFNYDTNYYPYGQ